MLIRERSTAVDLRQSMRNLVPLLELPHLVGRVHPAMVEGLLVRQAELVHHPGETPDLAEGWQALTTSMITKQVNAESVLTREGEPPKWHEMWEG